MKKEKFLTVKDFSKIRSEINNMAIKGDDLNVFSGSKWIFGIEISRKMGKFKLVQRYDDTNCTQMLLKTIKTYVTSKEFISSRPKVFQHFFPLTNEGNVRIVMEKRPAV